MYQNIYSKIKLYFLFTILFIFSVQLGFSKANFPIKNIESSSYQKINNTEKAKFKPFKKVSKKFTKIQATKRSVKFFGRLALLTLIFSFLTMAIFSFSIPGQMIAALLFIASCFLAYYGKSKDENNRLSRLIFIIDLTITLSALLVFWIITLSAI